MNNISKKLYQAFIGEAEEGGGDHDNDQNIIFPTSKITWANTITINSSLDMIKLDLTKPLLSQLIPYVYQTLKLQMRMNIKMIRDQILDPDVKNEITEKNILILFINSQTPDDLSYIGRLLKASHYPIPLVFPKLLPNGDIAYTIAVEILYEIYQEQHFPLIISLGFESKIGKTNLIKNVFPFEEAYMLSGGSRLSVLSSSLLYPSIDIYPGILNLREYLICDIHGALSKKHNEVYDTTRKLIKLAALVLIHLTKQDMNNLDKMIEIGEVLSFGSKKQKIVMLLRDSNLNKEKEEKELEKMISIMKMKERCVWRYFMVPNIKSLRFNREENIEDEDDLEGLFVRFYDDFQSMLGELKHEVVPVCDFSRLLYEENDKELEMELLGYIKENKGGYFNAMEEFLPISYYSILKDKLKLQRYNNNNGEDMALSIENDININNIFNYLTISNQDEESLFEYKSNCNEICKLLNKLNNDKKDNQLENYHLKKKLLKLIIRVYLSHINYSYIFNRFCIIMSNNNNRSLNKLMMYIGKYKTQYINRLEALRLKYKEEYNKVSDQSKKHEICTELIRIKDYIEYANINVDKLVNEYIIRYDRHYKLRQSINYQLTDIYQNWVLIGRPINLIRGIDLKLSNHFLDDIMTKCIQLDKNPKHTYVISIIGQQSTGKSTLMNLLFGTSFETNSGRCTKGMYASLVNSPELQSSNLMILDTEGLMSIDGRDHLFNHQMATFAFAISHIVLFNLKGEFTAESLRLLKFVVFALSKIRNKQKPKVMIVLRDINSQSSSQKSIVIAKIKESLHQMPELLNIDPKDIPNIGFEDFFSFGSPFIYQELKARHGLGLKVEENVITMPSRRFSLDVLDLRRRLWSYFIDNKGNMKIIEDDKSNDIGKPYKDLSLFYQMTKGIWKNIRKFGKSILDMESVEHIVADMKLAKIYEIVLSNLINQTHQKSNEIFNLHEKVNNNDNPDSSDLILLHIEESYQRIANEIEEEFIKRVNEQKINEEIHDYGSYHIKYKNKLKFECDRIWLILRESFEAKLFEIKQYSFMKQMEINIKKTYFDSLQLGQYLLEEYHLERLDKAKKDINSEFDKKFSSKRKAYNDCKDLVLSIYNLAIRKGFPYNSNRVLLSELSLEIDLHKEAENFVRDLLNTRFLILNGIENEVIEKLKECLVNIKEKTELMIRDMIMPTLKNVDLALIVRVIEIIIDIIFQNFESNINLSINNVKVNEFLNMLTIYIINIIVWTVHENELKRIAQFKKQLDDQIAESIKNIRIFLGCSINSHKITNYMIQVIFQKKKDIIIKNCIDNLQKKLRKKLIEEFYTPEAFLDKAWEYSFGRQDPEAILKYCIDINKYLDEIYLQEVKVIIGALTNRAHIHLEMQIKLEIDKILTEWLRFLTSSVSLGKQKFRLTDCPLFCDETVPDHEYDLYSFDTGFKEKFTLLKDAICIVADGSEIASIKASAIEYMIQIQKKYLGCRSRCPTCGNKCKEQAVLGHKHHTRHLLGAFHGLSNIHNKKRYARLVHCLSTQNYHSPFYDYPQSLNEKPKFSNLMSFLQNRNLDWLPEFQAYKDTSLESIIWNDKQERIVKECWMKVRLPLSKYYGFELNGPSEEMLKYQYGEILKEDHPIPYQMKKGK